MRVGINVKAATTAVRQWRFDPARNGTEAVAVWVLLPVEFHLSD
jgi:outer membrane biosynthesis protein TonB